jgi:hypothetical protein
VRKGGVEPPPLAGLDPKSSASANSATFAVVPSECRISGYLSQPAAGEAKAMASLTIKSNQTGNLTKPLGSVNDSKNMNYEL